MSDTCPRAERISTGTSISLSRSWERISKPSSPGSIRSRTIRSGRSSKASRTPASPSAAVSTRYPRSWKFIARPSRSDRSSSTTRMVSPRRLGRCRRPGRPALHPPPSAAAHAGRKIEKRLPDALLRVDGDLPAVGLDGVVHDRQPQPGPGGPGGRAAHPVERLEDPPDLPGGDADPVVLDGDDHPRPLVPDPQADPLRRRGVLGRVDQQVEDRLLQRAGVVADRARALERVAQLHLVGGDHPQEPRRRLVRHRADRPDLQLDEAPVLRRRPPADHPVDHRVQPLGLPDDRPQAVLGARRVGLQQPGLQRLRVDPDRGQRRAQVVGDVGQQVGLQPREAGAAPQQHVEDHRPADGRGGEGDHQDPEDQGQRALAGDDGHDADRRGEQHRQHHADGERDDRLDEAQALADALDLVRLVVLHAPGPPCAGFSGDGGDCQRAGRPADYLPPTAAACGSRRPPAPPAAGMRPAAGDRAPPCRPGSG